MKRIIDFYIKHHNAIAAVMIAAAVICGVLSVLVPVNKDRTRYLSDHSNMKQGLAIMNSQFPESEEKSSIRVMFDDLTETQMDDVLSRLKTIPNVSSVNFDPDSKDYVPHNHILYIVNSTYAYNSDEERAIEAAIETGFPEHSMVFRNNDIPTTMVPLWLLLFAVGLMIVILLIMCNSWLEPILFLITIGIAVIINMGTNIFFPYVDEMTVSIGPIIQLVLSMDYSIILMNRYRQEKLRTESSITSTSRDFRKKARTDSSIPPTSRNLGINTQTESRTLPEKARTESMDLRKNALPSDKTHAMKAALSGSVSSIISSSVTTAAGLMALVFLSFKLGPELGIVLAKGVLISMICVLTILPVLILRFDSMLEKTQKHSLHIPVGFLASFSRKVRFLMPFIFAALFTVFCILQGSAGISFLEKSEDPIEGIFPKDNTVVMLYRTAQEDRIGAIISDLESDEHITQILCYYNTLAKPLNAAEMGSMLKEAGEELPVNDTMLQMLYLLYQTRYGRNEMTVPELFDFICNDLMEDPPAAGFFDDATKAYILDRKTELDDAQAQMRGDEYSRMIITSHYPNESPETAAFIDKLRQICDENLEEYYLVGTSVMADEMSRTFENEYLLITIITAIVIFLVVLIAFRKPVIPLILTLLVQCGVFITVTVIDAFSGPVYYLALLIVQSILMGATIDYGIVFCSLYQQNRLATDMQSSLKAAYEQSMHTIMTSGTILVLVLASLGLLSPVAVISEVSASLSIGALIAIVLIIFVLPGFVACFDRFINRPAESAAGN